MYSSALSIPTIERLPGFSRIDELTVSGGRMTFRVIGSTAEFGADAADKFATLGLAASLGEHVGQLYEVEINRIVGTVYCTVSCSLPR